MTEVLLIERSEFEALKERLTDLEQRVKIAEDNSLEYVSVSQTEEMLNISRGTVYALLKRGEIEKMHDGKKINIITKSIIEYKKRKKIIVNHP